MRCGLCGSEDLEELSDGFHCIRCGAVTDKDGGGGSYGQNNINRAEKARRNPKEDPRD